MKKYFLISFIFALAVVLTGCSTKLGADGYSHFSNLVASGDISAGDDLTVADDLTVTGDVSITATTTFTGDLVANSTWNAVGATATSTLQVGKANKAGCLILGDSAGGANVVYITATGNTVTATTVKPVACNTAR